MFHSNIELMPAKGGQGGIMMNTLMSTLIKMSLRGTAIILIVLLVRFLLKKLRISHKYILGLWAMTFLFFMIPWKISLSIGFWNNSIIPEGIREIAENRENAGESRENILDNMADTVNSSGIVGNMIPAGPIENSAGTMNTGTVEPEGPIVIGEHEVTNSSLEKPEIWGILGTIWLLGLSGFLGHMLYSYFTIKRKLKLSVMYQDHIWWAENIDMPMVFGLIRAKIYLPISMEFEDLSYVISHEEMHIKRKDGLFKILAYVICLIHWFNPFIWLAYFLFGNDMEKACDEEVIRSMSKEKRKEYAYALIQIAAENGRRKKRVFVAPICFDEGNVKSRIKNIMKYKYTLPGIGAAVVILILTMSVVFLTEAKGKDVEGNIHTEDLNEESTSENDTENADIDIANGEEPEALPAFYVEDLSALQIGENFSLEDCYITSRYTASNYYYIDENGVLWGIGMNDFGQLGTGTYGIEEYYEEPVKIAENVLSVDASWNDYFCIYLTEGGELYGIGLNFAGVLLGKGSETQVYSQYDFQKVTKPVLLMTDVAYARAGRECIVALQNNKTAYWWGQYAPTTHTNADAVWGDYWKMEEDVSNPVKMLAIEPMKIMENCKYITTGTYTGAAISESGELYTWGFNVFGQCGMPVTEDDFVRTPVKVMDDVKMVWQGRIAFSDPISWSPEFGIWETDYQYNTFVLKEDNSLFAVGLNIGNKEKLTQLNGDIVETQTNQYSDTFVPIRAVEYSVNNNLAVLGGLEFGMSIEEVEEILSNAGLSTFRSTGEYVYEEGYSVCLCAQYGQYYCYFDSQNELARITIQEGGSRDGRFVLGMALSDLEKAVYESGGSLTKLESDTTWDIWVYQDQEQQIRYEFTVYEGSVTVLNEFDFSDEENRVVF